MLKPNGPPPNPVADRAAASNALVEAAARGALRALKPPPDLLTPDLLTAGFPFTPAYWMIVVEPLQPREESDGGIAVVDLSQEAESYQMTVGRVLKVGPAAMEGQTVGGVKLDNFTADIRKPEHLVGRYFVYQRHVGQELILRKTGQTIKVMKTTDLLGETDDPHAWRFYI
jgi:hypothetical protein